MQCHLGVIPKFPHEDILSGTLEDCPGKGLKSQSPRLWPTPWKYVLDDRTWLFSTPLTAPHMCEDLPMVS